MIIVPVKEGENIEKALKKFKRKFEKTGVVKELRNRQAFEKPSFYSNIFTAFYLLILLNIVTFTHG